MKLLKKRNRIVILVCVAFLYCSFVGRQQGDPPIDISMVKGDMTKFAGELIPVEVISKTENGMFGSYYVGKFCLVHLAYKDIATEAVMKSSVIALYEFHEKKWQFKKIIPYNYEISQLNREPGIFLSDNRFCYPNGSCTKYVELDVFSNEEMRVIYSHIGYDSTVYLEGLLSLGKDAEAQKAVGDTIVNTVKINNVTFNNKGIATYELLKEIGILERISDPLLVRKTTTRHVVEMK